MDTFTYLGAPSDLNQVVRITNKLTDYLTVQASADSKDDAVSRLQARMAEEATRSNPLNPAGGVTIIDQAGDPEMAKKKAEVAEKEKARAQRKLEAQQNRERDRANRVLGRSNLRTGGGLTIGGLEDDEGPRRARPKPRRQRRDDYDSDEDFRRGRTREDEYDEEDDFIAASDEELGAEDAEGEEDEEDIDEGVTYGGNEREGTPKRSRPAEVEGDETGQGSPNAVRVKRRRVVEEDDDEE